MFVVISTLGFFKFQQIQTAMAQGAAYQPPPEAVTTIVAKVEEWPSTLGAVGTVAAVQGVTVSADLPGTVDRITFDSGRAVRAGEVLVELNTRQERAQLAAAEADRELAKLTFTRMQSLYKEQVISKAEFDRALTEQAQTDARVSEIRAAIERKTIRAPFSGILGIRQVNLGQYLRDGDPVVELQALSPIYVNFDVPQQSIADMRTGREVRITTGSLTSGESAAPKPTGGAGGPASPKPTGGAGGPASPKPRSGEGGRITAVNSVVDPATRNIQVQATFDNRDAALRPGMFVQVDVVTGASQPVIALPASAISYAPYGDSVFIVTELKSEDGQAYTGVRQQFVKLGGSRGDQVAVVSGVNPHDEVVSSGVFKLRTGAAVLVNNAVQPGNNPVARPEDR
jgi:membrane fusion protein (multidrug efflux system)